MRDREQIEKAQEKVIKTKAAYDHAVDALQKLLDKRDSQRKDELILHLKKLDLCSLHKLSFSDLISLQLINQLSSAVSPHRSGNARTVPQA